jgi:predicted metalloprotease with PDZ domain
MLRASRTIILLSAFAIAALLPASTARAQALSPEAPRRTIGLLLHGNGNMIQVENVLTGSPADKAGVRPGDEVVSIAGITLSELNPDKLRAIMDTAKVIPVVVKRDGKPMTFRLAPVMITPPANPRQPSKGGAHQS